MEKEIRNIKLVIKDSLIVWDEKKFYFIDVNKKIIIKKIKPERDFIENIVPLNDNKLMLYFAEGKIIYKYIIEDGKNIIYEKENNLNIGMILSLIKYTNNNIISRGYDNKGKIIIYN